jgi:hypothetical protein
MKIYLSNFVRQIYQIRSVHEKTMFVRQMKDERISFRVNDNQYQYLKRKCEEDKITITKFMMKVINYYIKNNK